MFVIVDERELVTSGYAGRFDKEGVASARFAARSFRQWVESAREGELGAVEAFLIGECPKREEIPKLIRRHSRAPVIALAEARSLEQTLTLFSAGVDDVVRKPVHVREILARAQAIRRRAQTRPGSASLGAIETFCDGRDPLVGGAPLPLPRRELRILDYLLENRGRRVPKAELAAALYGAGAPGRDNAIETHLSKLRKKLRARLERDPIDSQRYLGYLLGAEA